MESKTACVVGREGIISRWSIADTNGAKVEKLVEKDIYVTWKKH